MLCAAMALAWTGRIAGQGACVRIGAWLTTYGVLFGLGVLSLAHLLPEAIKVVTQWQRSEQSPGLRVAFGFGSLAGEAAAVVAACMLLAVMHRLPRAVHFVLGTSIIFLALGGATWRLVR